MAFTVNLAQLLRIAGFAIGLILPLLAAWLWYVWPYSGVSLIPFWKWFLYGAGAGFLVLTVLVMWIGTYWPLD